MSGDPYGSGGSGPGPSAIPPGAASAAGPTPANGSGEPEVLLDDPLPGVRRITLNRPAKRNALNHPLRRRLFAALHEADADRDERVTVVRGAGRCFSAG
jgi:hypothetical protein